MDKQHYLVIEQRESVSVIGFTEPTLLDAFNITDVSKELTRCVTRNELRYIILDLSTVQMLSSQSLGMLLNLRHLLSEYDGKVVISGIEPKLYRVFKITNLQTVFEFYDSVEQALTAFD